MASTGCGDLLRYFFLQQTCGRDLVRNQHVDKSSAYGATDDFIFPCTAGNANNSRDLRNLAKIKPDDPVVNGVVDGAPLPVKEAQGNIRRTASSAVR